MASFPTKTSCLQDSGLPALKFATLFILLLAGMQLPLLAQQHGETSDPGAAPKPAAYGTVRVAVVGPNGNPLDNQAVVKLSNPTQHTANWQTTGNNSETTFKTLSPGTYEIEADALGYITGREQVELPSTGDGLEAKIVLDRDPSAPPLDAGNMSMPPKATALMSRGVKALQAEDFASADKLLDDADALASDNANLKFLLGYVDMRLGSLESAETNLAQATILDPHSGSALMLLGRVQLLRGRYAEAERTLQRAVAADPDNWVAHHLLAHAYLQQGANEEARQQAELAIAKGGNQATFAQLALGIALAKLGRNPEARQAFTIFLASQPPRSAAMDAQRWLATLPDRLVDPLLELDAPTAPLPPALVFRDVPLVINVKTPWQPPGVDDSKPAVTAEASCPLSQVLERAGQHAAQFVSDAAKFAAVEAVTDEQLDPTGNVISRETRSFDYTAALSLTKNKLVQVDEYRSQHYAFDDDRDRFVDTGFAALTLVFYPSMSDAFSMRCEGLGSWNGKAAWLVHFQQREDRPAVMQRFLVGGNTYPVMLKGRAWVAADSFQVLRIEAESMHPVPQIQLVSEHEIADYAPVNFPSHGIELWPPKTAEVFLAFHGHYYHRKHSFEHYMLFSVDTDQHVGQAKDVPAAQGVSGQQVN